MRKILLILISAVFASSSIAQTRTVGLIQRDAARSYDGYTLLSPVLSPDVYLIDGEGYKVHEWQIGWAPGVVAYLKPDGVLLRPAAVPSDAFPAGGIGGRIQEVDWDGTLLWDFVLQDSLMSQHHDVALLPNGNVLAIVWEKKTIEEVVAAGRDTSALDASELWPDKIVEIRKTGPTDGEIVWEWHAWDHLIQDFDDTKANFGVVEDHPELIDVNFAPDVSADWLHINSVNYNADLDQIVLSTPTLGELWVIDHSTTTEEAAGHTGGLYGKGGDLLYRWGNAMSYGRGSESDTKLFFQHDTQWIEPGLPGAGNMLVFDNGRGRTPVEYSSVIELEPPLQPDGSYLLDAVAPYGPESPLWQYSSDPVEDFAALFISGAQRLPNGNTLICAGPQGWIFEVTPGGDIVWEYISPVIQNEILHQGDDVPEAPFGLGALLNLVFRAYRYPTDMPGFAGKDLSRKGTIELAPVAVEDVPGEVPALALLGNYPNPVRESTRIAFSVPRAAELTVDVFNMLGQRVARLADSRLFVPGEHTLRLDASDLPAGTYVYRLVGPDGSRSRAFVVVP